jgi:hypothetical protein
MEFGVKIVGTVTEVYQSPPADGKSPAIYITMQGNFGELKFAARDYVGRFQHGQTIELTGYFRAKRYGKEQSLSLEPGARIRVAKVAPLQFEA